MSENGLSNLTKKFEGCKLKPYLCPAKVWTIGWGHAILPTEHFTEISQKQADDILKKDISWAEDLINNAVKAPINQNQFDALVDLSYNIGKQAFLHSTLLNKLNSYCEKLFSMPVIAPDSTSESKAYNTPNYCYPDVAREFLRWNKVNGKEVKGLTLRRQAEYRFFMSGCDQDAQTINAIRII